jgi:hypothetical protein
MTIRSISIVFVSTLALLTGCGSSAPGAGNGEEACVDGFIACPPPGFDGGALQDEYMAECVDPKRSGFNCGACGVQCTGSAPVCVGGSCASCAPSGYECDANLTPNGCCAGLKCNAIPTDHPFGTCE